MSANLAIDFGAAFARAREARPSSESFRRLDVSALHRGGLLAEDAPAREVHWGEEAWIIVRGGRGHVELVYNVREPGGDWEEIRERVALEWTGCNYGGGRPWFHCPSCDRRSRTLYGGRRFLCRHCSGFAYQVTREEPWERQLRRAQELRMRLGGDANLCAPFPARPKGMHRRTYQRLRDEYHEAKHNAFTGALATLH